MASIEKQIEKYVIDGIKNVKPDVEIKENHTFRLKKTTDNFITCPPALFDFHEYADSLKSSQAFAFNIFSGVKGVQFEYHMKAHNPDAQIDVMIEDNSAVHLYEVKFTEFTKFPKIEFKDKYFVEKNYKLDNDVAKKYIAFIEDVREYFNTKNEKIYGEGIKQLCSHLLGILNSIENSFKGKDVKLYSLCFDYPVSDEFNDCVIKYKKVLEQFKKKVDSFLKDVNLDNRMMYCGFVSAKNFIEDKKELLGAANTEYVKGRYFYRK